MNKYKTHIVVAMLFSLPSTIINFTNSLYANTLSIGNIIATTVFLLLWTIYGFYMGKRKKSNYMFFVSTFWLFGFFVNLIAMVGTVFPLIFIGGWFFIPLYAIIYYVKNKVLVLLVFLIPPILSILAYLLGVQLSKYKAK